MTVSGGAFSKVPTDYIGEDVTQFVCNGVTYVGTSAVDGAHSWKLISTLKPATCTADGLGKFACEYCDATKYAIIPAEHTWELTETVKEATCGEAGQAKYTCSVCGETKTEVIEATGEHDFEESLVDATNFVKTMETHQHRKIACLEEIAYLNGWISKDAVLEVYEVLKKNQYGQYLKDVLDGKFIDVTK